MVWSVFERGGGIQAKVVNGRPDALGAPDRGFTNYNNVVGEQAVVSVNRRIVGYSEVRNPSLRLCANWVPDF
jgi:hypothetical protein